MFPRYLLKQLQFAADKKRSIFDDSSEHLFTLRADVTFHFFASQIPCKVIMQLLSIPYIIIYMCFQVGMLPYFHNRGRR